MEGLRKKLWDLRNQLLSVYYSKRIVTKSQKYSKYLAWLPLQFYIVYATQEGNFDEFTYQNRLCVTNARYEAYYQHMDDLDDHTHNVLQHDYT